jgi:hypothetical protein
MYYISVILFASGAVIMAISLFSGHLGWSKSTGGMGIIAGSLISLVGYLFLCFNGDGGKNK